MISLLDINVLVALAWPNHVHHERAMAHFADLQAGGWATCPTTQGGFVRISSNHRVVPEARSPAECALLLRRIVGLEGHVFWPDDVSWIDSPFVDLERIVGYRQVTDAHLLALALRHGGRIVTFDRSLAALVPASVDASKAVIELD